MKSKFEPVVRFIECFDNNVSKAAAALGVASTTLSEWRDHERPVPVKKAVLMERLSCGKVRRIEFFPADAAEIWPEHVDHEVAATPTDSTPDSPPALANSARGAMECVATAGA